MKRFLILAIVALAAMPSIGQTTVVTGTVLDSSGIPYAGGQVQAIFLNVAGGASPVISSNNSPVVMPPPSTIALNGTFSVLVTPNASISPAGTQYVFSVCGAQSSPSNQPDPMLTGGSCFLVGPVTVSGTTQTLTVNSSSGVLNTSGILAGFITQGVPPLMQPIIAWSVTNGGTGVQQLPVQTVLTSGKSIAPYSTQIQFPSITIVGLTNFSACTASLATQNGVLPPPSWQTGIQMSVTVTTNTATLELTNPTGWPITPIPAEVNVKCIQ